MPRAPHVRVLSGVHAPSSMHAPKSDHWPVLASQLRVRVPHLPQASAFAPGQRWFSHAPHWQLPPQLCVPSEPQACVALGAHTPGPLQSDHSLHTPLSQRRVCVPQLPQAREVAPSHVWLKHSPHSQSPPQVRVPPRPQASAAPGMHTPSPLQRAQSPHTPSVQSRPCVPHMPQD